MGNLKPVNSARPDEDFDTLEEAEIIQLVGLKLGEEEYAIDVLKIQEIIRTVEITSVPRTDPFVLGVMNLRGKVIPVVDLRVRFSLDKMDFDKETRIIVVRFETEHIGFVVDEVTEVIRISKNMVEPTPPLVGSIGQEYILGICKYDDRLIILLDIDTVISEGKAAAESALRKRFLGQPAIESRTFVNYDDVASSVEKESVGKTAEISDSSEPEETEHEEDSKDELDNIDDLIAKELAKREQETEELNKKKQQPKSPKAERDEDVEDILKDALSQSDHAVVVNEDLVVQDELDALIAQELAKRERETDELNRIKKEQEKKNEKLNGEEVDLSHFFNEPIQEPTPKTVSKPVAGGAATSFGPSFDELLADILPAENPVTTLSADEAAENTIEQLTHLKQPDNAVKTDSIFSDDIVSPVVSSSTRKGTYIDTDPLEELKNISHKIINGDAVDLGIDIKGEIGELLRLIMNTKNKVDEIDPTLLLSKESMPVVVKSLEQVNEKTEEATLNLMEAADKMIAFYTQFINDIGDFEDLAYKKDTQSMLKCINGIENDISMAEGLSFGILHALEFQDITEQKMTKVIRSVEEIGARIGALLGIINAKKMESGETISGATQDDIDSLLADFGLN